MDIQKLFDTDFSVWLNANADSVRRVGAKYIFNITGDGGGQWYLDLSSTGPKIERSAGQRADCTITLNAADFLTLWGNLYAGESMYYSGRIWISGDEMLAMSLRDVLQRIKLSAG
jgi:predicted lipid carrier protein YhbT